MTLSQAKSTKRDGELRETKVRESMGENSQASKTNTGREGDGKTELEVLWRGTELEEGSGEEGMEVEERYESKVR